MADRSCDTCAHKAAETRGADGARMVECDANELQMHSPYAEDCKHWERGKDDR